MQIGERLKRIRNFRGLTQKDLGIALGFNENTASTRIAHYESGIRIPKKETAIAIAKILDCNFVNLYEGNDLGKAEQIMMNFFWLEEDLCDSLYVFELKKYNDQEDSRIAHGMYNDYQYDGVFPPVALALNYNLINSFMREWATRYQELHDKKISKSEYFEWKINWPATCDDGGRFEPSYQWRKKDSF